VPWLLLRQPLPSGSTVSVTSETRAPNPPPISLIKIGRLRILCTGSTMPQHERSD
jgi:hypothetical protein